MTYALISTAVALAGIGGTVAAVKYYRAKVAEISQELNEAIHANYSLRKEMERREHIIQRQQEVQLEAEKQKNEIRNHADPTDRANAASGIMSKLSRGSDRD